MDRYPAGKDGVITIGKDTMKRNQITMILILLVLALMPQSAPRAQDAESTHTGTVLFSQVEGRYAYIQLDVEGKEVWIATLPEFLKVTISKGDKLEYSGGLLMNNFKSKAMKRTFDSIWFITKVKVVEKDSIQVPKDSVHTMQQPEVTATLPPERGEIEKAKGGKTIAEIYFEREVLKGTEVLLQARVMKVSKNILKKNWVTLQDGTGNPPNNSITFTTKTSPGIGETITVRGIVKTDIDLGGNYQYKVLLEDSALDMK